MKYLSLIEDFFLGKLKGNVLESFRRELNLNSELRNEFNIYKKALDFSISQENKLIKDINKMKEFKFNSDHLLDIEKFKSCQLLNDDERKLLNTLHAENHEINEKKRIKLKDNKCAKVAAIIILLIGLGITGILIFPDSINDDELFDKYYSTYKHTGISRSSSSDNYKTIYEGLILYDKGNYSEALSKLINTPESLTGNLELYIIEAISYIELKNYHEAIKELKKISQNSLLYTTSLWYQGLCYLKLKDNKMAKEIFRKLKSVEPYYQKETKKLLRHL